MFKIFKNRIGNSRGFTLIELLVVISIIALLSSIVLTSVQAARIKAKDATLAQNLKQLDLAIQLYMDSTGAPPRPSDCGSTAYGYCNIYSYPSALGALIPSYISSVDFLQDLDWSGSLAAPTYIFDIDTFLYEHSEVVLECGGENFENYVIAFPTVDPSSRNIDLPFPTLLSAGFWDGYAYCLGG